MDKKLLLGLQYSCNGAGLAVPWNDIGRIMGEGITGGAVVQHLAKLRNRMIAQGLPVPPPLRRGGGSSRMSTSATSSFKAKATPKKTGSAQANPKSTKPNPTKAKAAKKGTRGSGDSEDEDDAWDDDDSDADYGEPRAKRVKSDAKGPMQRRMKTEDSDEETPTPSKSLKRKHQSSKPSTRNLSAYGATDINGKPTGDYSDVDDDTNAEVFAAGAPWLAMEDDDSHPKTGKKTPYKKKSLVVSIPAAPYIYKTGMIGAVKEEENHDIADDKSEEDVVGSRVESCVDGSNIISTEEMNQEFSTSPYDQDFSAASYNQNIGGLAPAEQEPVSGFSSYNGMSEEPFFDVFPKNSSSSSGFQASNGIFEGNGGNYTSTYNGDLSGSGDFDGDSFGFEGGNAFSNNIGGLSLSNGHNLSQTALYPIQTSWQTYDSSAGASYDTSVNQTPAGTSAGVDFGTGYFGNGDFNLNSFGEANTDFSANGGADLSFNPGQFDGNADGNFESNFHGDLAGGGLYGNDYYGN